MKESWDSTKVMHLIKGLRTHLLGGVIYKGYGFFFYENTKKRILNNPYIRNRSFLIFLSGSLSGVFAQLLSYPFDVIKKKMQATQDSKSLYIPPK
jgi:hypothetical protein